MNDDHWKSTICTYHDYIFDWRTCVFERILSSSLIIVSKEKKETRINQRKLVSSTTKNSHMIFEIDSRWVRDQLLRSPQTLSSESSWSSSTNISSLHRQMHANLTSETNFAKQWHSFIFLTKHTPSSFVQLSLNQPDPYVHFLCFLCMPQKMKSLQPLHSLTLNREKNWTCHDRVVLCGTPA